MSETAGRFTSDLSLRDTVWHFAPRDGAKADQGRIAASLGGDDDVLTTCAAADAAGLRPASATADVALTLTELVAAEFVKFFKTKIFRFIAELQQGFQTVWRLGPATAEGSRTRECSVCGRRA